MSTRKTLAILTKYEIAEVLSTRAEKIAQGQPITIPNPGTTNPLEIAKMELAAKKSPVKITRKFPDGTFDEYNINELTQL